MTNTSTAFDNDDETPRAASSVPQWCRDAFARLHPEFSRDGQSVRINGRWVQLKTYRETPALFWRGVHGLDESRTHKAADLASTPDWDERPRGQRIAIGRCFKYFALNRVLPIILVNPEDPYNFEYRLTSGLEQPPTIH